MSSSKGSGQRRVRARAKLRGSTAATDARREAWDGEGCGVGRGGDGLGMGEEGDVTEAAAEAAARAAAAGARVREWRLA